MSGTTNFPLTCEEVVIVARTRNHLDRSVLLLCCALASGACTPHAPPYLRHIEAPAAAAHDSLLIPGVRMGAVALGMTESQLKRSVGPAWKSIALPTGKELHWYKDLSLGVSVYEGRVYKIETSSIGHVGIVSTVPLYVHYQTADGIGIGSTKRELIAKLGLPEWSKLVHRGNGTFEVMCYAGDTEFQLGVTSKRVREEITYIALGGCDDGAVAN